MKLPPITVIVALGLAGITQSTLASCSQSSPAGKWAAYSVGNGQSTGAYWVKCRLSIGSNGDVSGKCADSSGNSTGVTGSLDLTNASECAYKGSIRYKANGAISKVTEATLAPNHDTASGVGNFSDGTFAFNMVRY